MLWLNQDHKISSSNHNETLLVSISYSCLFYEIVSKQTQYLYPPYLSNCTKAWGTVVSVITIALRICNTCNKWFLLLADCNIFLIICTYSRADANECIVIVSTIFDFVLCFTIDYRTSSVFFFFEVVGHGRKCLAQNLEKSDYWSA